MIALYDRFTDKQISDKIAKLLTPQDIHIPVSVIFQSLEGLHKSCPHHTGDWYFSGDYPTPGGNKVVNIAFINFMEKLDVRAY